MSLPTQVIDRLFQRLAGEYLDEWQRKISAVPIVDVKTAWADQLAEFSGRLEAIVWGLQNLPERAPNAIQFRNLCRTMPAPATPMLPMPAPNPERMRQEMEKLGHIAKRPAQSRFDQKAWARKIIANHDAGFNVRPISLRLAREAIQTPGERAGLTAD